MRKTVIYFLLMLTHFHNDGQGSLGYQSPHQDILKLADAKPAPWIRLDYKAENALLLHREMYKSIAEMSEEEVRLAGLRIDPSTNMPSRTTYAYDITYLDPSSGVESRIMGLPERGRYANLTWNKDQNKAAVINIVDKKPTLWIIDIEKKTAKMIMAEGVHGSMGSSITWLDEKSLLVKVTPDNQKSIVKRSEIIPMGPTISENDGQKAQNRTYQDLLKNPTDERNFESLAHSKLLKVDLEGTAVEWLPSKMYDEINVSPDGNFVMVTHIKKPFSYLVPYSRFPNQVDIYDVGGNLVKSVFDIPLIEEMPSGFMATHTHPRRISWRSDTPATLYWAEALDGGDPEAIVDYRDVVMEWEAPFVKAKQKVVKTKLRYSGITWCKEDFAILYEYWWNTRQIITSFINPSNPSDLPRKVFDRNYQDRYSDPGNIVFTKNDLGAYVAEMDGDNLYLMGDGYSEEGKFPFIDQLNIKTLGTKRLFQIKNDDKLEDFVTAIDMKKGEILTRIESKNEYPNFYRRNIKNNTIKQVTKFQNPFEYISKVHKEVINYKRGDGLELSATLYLPVGYDKDKKEKMPMLMWAYPREFKDKNSASQNTNNPNEFTYPYYGSPIYWVNRGYVVLDDAAFPIVGEGDEEPNDSFITQLVDNAKAAIDAVDELGYIDRARVGVGGHSYGAFMTANLLSHSDLFAAGIARSGAYNRTLTPFGFQSEERNYWEAPDIYYNMSPFMHADKMKTPLLLIHGEEDNNSGTYPMQSERYFNALKGLGATVRLVMLPKESHGYSARESIMHMLWEQDTWLEKYVKNKGSESRP